MRLDPDHDLSPQAIAALRDLLHEPEPSKEELSDERLESFVLGTASDASRRETIRALVASRALRLRLTALRDDLRQVGARGMAHEPDGSTLSEVLGHSVGHALGLHASYDAWNADPDWATLDERAPAGLRVTLAAIGRNIAALLATPRYATLRRGAAPAYVNPYAEIDDEGTLTVDVVFGPSAPESHRACLDLIDPAGGTVRLGSAPVERRMARFSLQGLGPMLGLEAGSLPGDLFGVVTEAEEAPPALPGFLVAEGGAEEAVVLVTTAPVWDDGFLSVGIALPPAVRERPGVLELFVKAGSVEVALHSCPLSEFGNGEKTIRAPADGRCGPKNVCGSLLRARILPTDPLSETC